MLKRERLLKSTGKEGYRLWDSLLLFLRYYRGSVGGILHWLLSVVVLLVRVDDIFHELVAHDVVPIEVDE